ncbi:MAG TPA: hypothetical protein VG916_10435, partial [Gemmatimonadaceae bacterium]|nr:hypothetical protein [Gemmatimonadaceae bacterium]
MPLSILTALLLLVARPAAEPLRGVRAPAYAPDGRLAVSIDGHLFAQESAGGRWVQLTTGATWDRDPAWTRDGAA